MLKLRNLQLVERLSEARDRLEERVAERTTELASTVTSLREAELRSQEAVRVRNDFLAVASHELRTPLATLALQVPRLEWLLAQTQGGDRQQLTASAETLRRQVRRLTGLVDTVLTASGLARHGLVLEQVELDLSALVRAAATDTAASTSVPDTPVTLTLDQPVMGLWDPARVEQVVANLVSNALKYGRGHPVQVSLTASPQEAVLEVHDDGPGIDPALQDRIFERFFRADAGGQSAGLGLGLAVVRELVDRMRGRVSVVSHPAHGATFTVHLPRGHG
jgi:signal transduction histidine kinase